MPRRAFQAPNDPDILLKEMYWSAGPVSRNTQRVRLVRCERVRKASATRHHCTELFSHPSWQLAAHTLEFPNSFGRQLALELSDQGLATLSSSPSQRANHSTCRPFKGRPPSREHVEVQLFARRVSDDVCIQT